MLANGPKHSRATGAAAATSTYKLDGCTLPLTAYKKVNRIITELAVIDVTADGLVLREINKNTTVEDVVRLTEAKLVIPENIETF